MTVRSSLNFRDLSPFLLANLLIAAFAFQTTRAAPTGRPLAEMPEPEALIEIILRWAEKIREPDARVGDLERRVRDLNDETKRLREKRGEADRAEPLPKWSSLLLVQVTDVAPFNERVRALGSEPVFVPAASER